MSERDDYAELEPPPAGWRLAEIVLPWLLFLGITATASAAVLSVALLVLLRL